MINVASRSLLLFFLEMSSYQLLPFRKKCSIEVEVWLRVEEDSLSLILGLPSPSLTTLNLGAPYCSSSALWSPRVDMLSRTS